MKVRKYWQNSRFRVPKQYCSNSISPPTPIITFQQIFSERFVRLLVGPFINENGLRQLLMAIDFVTVLGMCTQHQMCTQHVCVWRRTVVGRSSDGYRTAGGRSSAAPVPSAVPVSSTAPKKKHLIKAAPFGRLDQMLSTIVWGGLCPPSQKSGGLGGNAP